MLYLKKNIESTLLAIWRIDETEEKLLSMLSEKVLIAGILSIKSPKIRLEKLAVRALLKELLGEEKEILYKDSGRPYFADSPYHISMSHTRGYVAIAFNKEKEVGVDIEQISDKIQRVKSRVVSAKEFIDTSLELEHLLLHWSAKEAVFKVLDTEGIDYLVDLYVHPFQPENEGLFKTTEYKTSQNKTFDVYYRIENDFVLTCLTF